MSDVEVSIIICTHNRAAELGRVLDDLASQAGIGRMQAELIVVDNNSSDATRGLVEARAAGFPLPVRYLFEPTQGKSHALNRGIREARGAILAFTDDDVRLPPRWLAGLLAPFARASCMGVAGAVRPYWSEPPPAWVSESEPYRMMAAIVQYWQGPEPGLARTAPIGANCAWRRDVFERHGGYRTDLGPAGAGSLLGEDTEFGLRMQGAGEEIWYTPEAMLYHPVAPDRLRKEYFLAWYFHSGKAEAYRRPEASVRIAGVPRYLFRELIASAARWLFSRAPARRFYFKLLTWQAAGRIRGYRERRRVPHP
ncbi:MAG TPA: glycosyltransferase [Gemmatimonadales bacterium]